MDNQIQIPLNLPDVRVLEVSQTLKSEWLIRVESMAGGTTCHKCGERITDLHGLDAPLRLRHLPLFEVPVYLELLPKRYRCRCCAGGPTTTEQPSWYQRRSPNTTAYEQWLLRILINSTISDVSHKLQVSEATVTGVLERWIETSVNWDAFSAIAILGIDEISLKRGHRDFVAIITTKTALGVQVLAVLGDRKKATVLNFLSAIPSDLKQTITTVCTDMYQGYVNAAQEALPAAKVVVDRFHVACAYRNGADAVRKRELKRLKQTLSKAEYVLLKGVMWSFRKRPADLLPPEKTPLNRLFIYSPELEQAYTLREQLTDIFDGDHTKQYSGHLFERKRVTIDKKRSIR